MKKVLKKVWELIQSGTRADKRLIPAYLNPSGHRQVGNLKKITLMFVFIFAGLFTMEGNAQILKKITKKIEQQAERRVDRKVDNTIDKGFNKVEEGVDNSIKEGAKKEDEKSKKKTMDIAEASIEKVSFLTDDEPYSLEEADMVKMKDGLVMVSGNCDEYIWFKPGASMSFKTTSVNGKKEEVIHSKMLVKKVSNENGKIISEVNVSAEEGIDLDIRYLCSGKNLYVDMGAAIKQAMMKSGQDNPESNAVINDLEMGFGDGFMDIPKNMYPGQKLNDVNFTMKSKASGAEMTIITNLTERKVGPKEMITTPAGTFECMPVTGIRKSSMKIMGINRNMGKPTTETIWYSPGIGMVKSENYDAKGKLESSQILTEFKR
jgi:hypothetical protein